jgi:hypothetical protein
VFIIRYNSDKKNHQLSRAWPPSAAKKLEIIFQLERTVTSERGDKDLAIKFDIQRIVINYI